MGEQRIKAALREATDTQNVNIRAGALASVPGLFLEGFGHSPAVVVADENTFEVAGKEVRRRLERAGHTMMESYADWLVAEALEVEKIDPVGWSLVQDHLRGWTDGPAELRAGDQKSTDRLMEGLILSGLGMQSYQSSRTASGAEHQFSHLWEMEGLGHGEGHEGTPLSHGFKVGVGTVAIAALYELVLERDLGDLDIETLRDTWPTREAMERSVRAQHTSPDLERGAVEQTPAKYISAGELAQRLALLRDVWPGLREKVRVQLMPAVRVREMLQAAGCPTSPVEIGLGWEDFEATYLRARTIRKRYTVLDLAFEAGILEECVDELFAPDGFWGRAAASHTRADGTRLVGSVRSDVREKHDDG